jgi:disulfide bond formation protein DsbB
MSSVSASLRAATPLRVALVVLAVAMATIGGAWIYESLGFSPCELCLKQRIPYYAAIPVAALAAFAAGKGKRRLAGAGLALIALMFAAGAALALYHSGVELKIFEGPTDCTGALSAAGKVEDFFAQLQTAKVVRCDQPALWVLGLTLSNWNVLISSALAAVALVGWRRSAAGTALGRHGG